MTFKLYCISDQAKNCTDCTDCIYRSTFTSFITTFTIYLHICIVKIHLFYFTRFKEQKEWMKWKNEIYCNAIIEDWFDLNFYFYTSYRNFTFFHFIRFKEKKNVRIKFIVIYISIKKQAKFKITNRNKIKNKNLRYTF